MNNRMMRIRLLLLILLVFSLLISGCSNDEYKAFEDKFNSDYFEVVKSIDIQDTMKSLENLQSSKNNDLINNMLTLLDEIKDEVPNSKKEHYVKLNNWYKELKFLQSSYANWDKLTVDDKSKISTQIIMIDLRIKDWEKKK